MIHLTHPWNAFITMSLGFVCFVYFPKCSMRSIWIFTHCGRKEKQKKTPNNIACCLRAVEGLFRFRDLFWAVSQQGKVSCFVLGFCLQNHFVIKHSLCGKEAELLTNWKNLHETVESCCWSVKSRQMLTSGCVPSSPSYPFLVLFSFTWNSLSPRFLGPWLGTFPRFQILTVTGAIPNPAPIPRRQFCSVTGREKVSRGIRSTRHLVCELEATSRRSNTNC